MTVRVIIVINHIEKEREKGERNRERTALVPHNNLDNFNPKLVRTRKHMHSIMSWAVAKLTGNEQNALLYNQ